MPPLRNHKQRQLVHWLQWLFALLLVPQFCSAQNAVLHLRNGDRISGEIISESTNQVVITTSFAGRVTIAKDQVVRRETLPAAAAQAPSPSGGTGKPASSAGSTNAPIATGPVAGTVAPPKAVATKPAETKTNDSEFRKFLSEWHGELELGVNLGYSTKNRQTYSGRVKAIQAHPMPNHTILRNTADYLFSYGTTEGVLVDNRMDGSWKTDYEIGKRFLVYGAIGAGYDEIRKIDLHYDLGPGIGYKLITRTNFVLKTELGGNYQQQFFADDTEQSRYSLRLAEESWWQISNKLRLDEKLEFFPQVTDWSDYRVRAESNLSFLLLNNLTFKLTVIDLYETSPARSVSNNDLQIRSSIGIKF